MKPGVLKIVLIVGVVAVLCSACIFAEAKILASTFGPGDCLDKVPSSEEAGYDGSVVSCDSPEAVVRVVELHYGATLDQADACCAHVPGYAGAIWKKVGNSLMLFCFAEV